MITLRCTNDNGVVQDLPVQESLDLLLDISAIENATIGSVYGISSQEFAIPGIDLVNQFFGNLYNLGASAAVALQNSIDCQVLLDGAEVFKGKLYINNIVTDQRGFTIYNTVVVNETVDFKFEIQDKLLTEYDFSRFNHNFTYTNVSSSWSGNLLSGSIVYPFVEYGFAEDDPTAPNYEFASFVSSGSNTIDNFQSPLRLEDFKPAIKVKDVVDIIFSGSSYAYTSSFFNSEYFNTLYTLTSPDDTLGPTNVSPVSQSAWAYNASGSQSILTGTQSEIDFDSLVVDNANQFSLALDRYTAATTGVYNYQVNISYITTGWSGYSNLSYATVILRKNGSTIVDSFNQVNVPPTSSLFLQGGINLIPGDYLEVEVAYNGGGFGAALEIRNEVGQPSYLPNGNLTYFQIKGPATAYAQNVDMSAQFPDNLKAQDFLEGLIEKFNLVVEPVPNSRNLIRIEPYQDWIDAGKVVDWTNKVDRNVRFAISHPVQDQPRVLNFSDLADDDILNKYNIETNGTVYGSYQYVSDSDLANGERSIGKVFAATPVTGIPNGRTFVIPHLCTSSNLRDRRPFKFKPRLLYNAGLQPVPQTALGISGSTSTRGTIYVRDENTNVNSVRFWNQMTTLTSVPVNYNTGQDLHFNNDQHTPYFQASANGKVKADAFRTYWATYINSLYDVDSRKLTCNVYLKPTEIQNIALNDRIFIDGQYYRINKINGANLSRRDTVEVELIKILAFKLKFPRRLSSIGNINLTLDYQSLSVDGTGRYINVDTGATVEEYAEIIGPASKDGLKAYNVNGTASVVWDYQQPFDASNQFSQTVLGNNKVAIGASKVTAIGNLNEVKEGSESSFVIGSNNLIAENTSNVTVMGQNHSVSEQSSNAQILGGFNNAISASNNQATIINGYDSAIFNSDYAVIINGQSADIRDSDNTTSINPAENEVVLNGSGHTVLTLNREGGGIDLLEKRNNSNYLGDTYLGGGILIDSYTINVGDGTNYFLTGSNLGGGKHESVYLLNWNGLSPGTASINLPNAANNDYKGAQYTFKANGTFDGTTYLRLVPFTAGQDIDGQATLAFSSSYDVVTIFNTGSDWYTLSGGVGTGGGGAIPTGSFGNFFSSASQALVSAGVSQSVTLTSTYPSASENIYFTSGSRIYLVDPGVYQFNWQAQIQNNDNAVHNAAFWVKYNGVDYPNSTTYVSMRPRKSSTEFNYQLMNATFTGVAQNANDYIELYWTGDSTALSLFATGSQAIDGAPAVASVIANVIEIGGVTGPQGPQGPVGPSGSIINGFPYTGSAEITGSLTVTGSISSSFNGNFSGVTVGGSGDTYNTILGGGNTLAAVTSGQTNTAIGARVLGKNSVGSQNTALGYSSLFELTSGSRNTAIGERTLDDNVLGNNNIALGYLAGNHHTGSNALFIDSITRGNLDEAKGGSIIYGFMTASAVDQELRLNAGVLKAPYLPTSSYSSFVVWDKSQGQLKATNDLNISGSLGISGSVRGNYTKYDSYFSHSLDCNIGNFFDITLDSSSNTHLEFANISVGQTINVIVQTGANAAGTMTFGGTIKQPSGSEYVPTQLANSIDALSAISALSGSTPVVYVVSVKHFV